MEVLMYMCGLDRTEMMAEVIIYAVNFLTWCIEV